MEEIEFELKPERTSMLQILTSKPVVDGIKELLSASAVTNTTKITLTKEELEMLLDKKYVKEVNGKLVSNVKAEKIIDLCNKDWRAE